MKIEPKMPMTMTRIGSFVCVTAHVLDGNKHFLPMILAARRLTGSHMFVRITEMIFSIFREYGLDTNLEIVRAIVTDNTSNFLKAFKQNSELTIEPHIKEGDSDTDIDAQERELDNIETFDLHKIFDTYGRVGLVSPRSTKVNMLPQLHSLYVKIGAV